MFQRAVLSKAAASIGLNGLHPHELRHMAASLAIASGANVKVVQQVLGRKSATMTLDLYGHLLATNSTRLATRWTPLLPRVADELRTPRGLAAR